MILTCLQMTMTNPLIPCTHVCLCHFADVPEAAQERVDSSLRQSALLINCALQIIHVESKSKQKNQPEAKSKENNQPHKKQQCNICDKYFAQSKFQQHYHKCHNDKNGWPCPFCHQQFEQKGGLKTHKSRHHRGMK